MWAVLTRLEEPKNAGLTLLQKLKLYNGKTLPGFTEDNIKELRKEADARGHARHLARATSRTRSPTPWSRDQGEGCINPFMVLNELEAGLQAPLADHQRGPAQAATASCSRVVKRGVRGHRQERGAAGHRADEDAITRLCANYIDNIKAYTQREKVRNKYTGQYEEPDERLMRSIEEKIDIPESRKDDFRREIMNYIGALAIDGKTFDYQTNERLHKALELKLFEDQKDTIKLTSLVSSVVDEETQEKIDVVKQRLIKNYGYNEISATDVLNYVASIFARGDAKDVSVSRASARQPDADAACRIKIDQDHAPLPQIVRGKIKQNLRKYITHGEMIGQKGKDLVTIPVPTIDIPHFRYGEKRRAASARARASRATRSAPAERQPGSGQAGERRRAAHPRGRRLARGAGRDPRRGAGAAAHRAARASDRIVDRRGSSYTGIRRTGPESLRHFKRTYKQALRRQIATGTYNPVRPGHRPGPRGQALPLLEAGPAARRPTRSSST